MGNNTNKEPAQSHSHRIDPTTLHLHGLYATCAWDEKTIKRLITTRKVAPCYKGQGDQVDREMEECPICMLFYPGGLNRCVCCHQSMCTECYFQVKKPGDTPAPCPFCNSSSFNVVFKGPKTAAERAKDAEEEQKVVALEKKMREEEEQRDRERMRLKMEQQQQQKLAQQQQAQKNAAKVAVEEIRPVTVISPVVPSLTVSNNSSQNNVNIYPSATVGNNNPQSGALSPSVEEMDEEYQLALAITLSLQQPQAAGL